MDRSKIYGIISSALFMLLTFLVLLFVYMPEIIRPVEEEGIMVSFGDAFDGAGFGEVLAGEEDFVLENQSSPESDPTGQQELMTQENQPTVAVPKQQTSPQQNRPPTPDPAQQLREKQRQEAIAQAEAKKRAEAVARSENLVGSAFGTGGAGSGADAEDSRQGNPAGKGTSGGHGWSLAGRSLVGSIATPAYPSNVEGKVTVSIRVDAAGAVTSASIGSPTDISDGQTRNAALSAARKTRFTPGSGVSNGTITYNFNMK